MVRRLKVAVVALEMSGSQVPVRGLSTHSWGCAIDLSPALNGMGIAYNPKAHMIPAQVVAIFSANGWEWGGLWQRPDAMHFQAARVSR